MNFEKKEDFEPVKGETLTEVEILPSLKKIENLISRTCEFFFKGNIAMRDNFPFKGFILEGLPGTGKTEIIRQVANKLDRRMQKVWFLFVDGARIATPKWGEAERILRDVFKKTNSLGKDQKLIVLFDDIESLMLARGSELAKEWHYSINSVLFHEIDNLDTTKIIVCATTNRPDLIDEALRSRLYPIYFPPLPIEELKDVIDELLEVTKVENKDKDYIRGIVIEELKKLESPTIRDAKQITVVKCIEKGVWSI